MPQPDEIKRRNGDVGAILDGLVSKSPLYRLQAICGAVNHSIRNERVLDGIKALVNDDEIIVGYKISALAIAALVKFGKAEYQGKDSDILAFIDAQTWFE